MTRRRTDLSIPIWEKTLLTVDEASAYSGLGVKRIKAISNDDHCNFVLWAGNKRLIKRKLFDEYLDKVFSI